MNAITVIKEEVHKPNAMKAISAALGKSADSPEIMKYINGAMLEIMNSEDLRKCTISSIVNSLIECATVGLAVDNRKLAYLIKMGDKATLMPGYHGYIYKIKQAEPSANITVNIVFEGDTFTDRNEDGNAFYTHEVGNSFNDDTKKIIGAYCYIKTDSFSCLEKISKKEIEKIRSKSKMRTGAVWGEWEMEMIKKSVIRRAGKRNFMAAIAKLDNLDNRFFELKNKPKVIEIADSEPLPEIETDTRKVEDLKEEKEAKTEDNIGIKVTKGKITYETKPSAKNKYYKICLSGNMDLFFQTDNKEFIHSLTEAKKNDKEVELTYTQTKNGRYINNIIETIKY